MTCLWLQWRSLPGRNHPVPHPSHFSQFQALPFLWESGSIADGSESQRGYPAAEKSLVREDRKDALGEEKFWELSQRLALSRDPWGLLEGSRAHLDQFHRVRPREGGFLGREGLH